MSVRVTLPTTVDVARTIEGLLLAAETADVRGCPLLAQAFVDLANRWGDALDAMGPGTRGRVEASREHVIRYLEATEVLVNGRAVPKAG